MLIIIYGLFGAANPAFAQTWTLVTNLPYANWNSVAISPDGTKLLALNPSITKNYISTNSGVTWFTNNLRIGIAASSLDGSKWVGASSSSIFYSTNSGINWQSIFDLTDTYQIACSADGNILAAQGFTYVSTNLGKTWIYSSANPRGFAIFLDNGAKWIGVWNGGFYTSLDSGATWTTNNLPSTHFSSFASSADGTKLVAVDLYYDSSISGYAPRPLYQTTNAGNSWFKANVPSNIWRAVATSDDGNRLVAVAYPSPNSTPKRYGGIYTSTDDGASWISNSVPVTNWISVASSADGSKLAAAVSGGGIYTAFSSPASPQLNFTPSNTNFVLSWFVPSTNFALQHNLDLATGNWVTVTNIPILNFTNMQYEVTALPTNSSGFFRLQTQ